MSNSLQISPTPVIHLICGATGAGKSTYANLLKSDIGAVHFSIDAWMMSLFGPDLKNPLDWKWISDRASRCEEQILSIACALAKTGTSSILEIGLQRAHKRETVISTIAESGCSFQTHFLNIEATERWRRIEQRNSEKGVTFSLIVTRDMFDFFEQMWEAPGKKELASLHVRELITSQV